MNVIGKAAATLLLISCAAAPGAEKAITVVMMGDSTTLCADMPAGHKLTDYVQSGLASNGLVNPQVINAGKGRDTVHGACPRLKPDVLAHNPDLVTVSFGLNDSVYLTPPQFREGLELLVRSIQTGTTARIVLVTSTPFVNARNSLGAQYKDKGGMDEYLDANICSEMREVAEKFKLPLCDLHAAFSAEFQKNPGLADTLIQADGVHLTDDGNRMAARHLFPVILGELKKRGD